MAVREPVFLDDVEMMGLLRSINDADYAGQWGRSDASSEAVPKILAEATRRGLPLGEFSEIADLAPEETQAEPAPRSP